jgi:hypothetical protein
MLNEGDTAMSIYRKIYEEHYGSIPKDINGRSYDIHHIDGNPNNNDISNLIALSIQEHYNIHYSQGDFGACWLLSRKIKMTPEELSELSKKVQNDRIRNNNHHFVGENNPSKISSKNGSHPLSKEKGTAHNRKMIDNGIHPLVGGKVQKQAAKILLEKGKHHSQKILECPHCGKNGKSNSMYRYHFDRCKERK